MSRDLFLNLFGVVLMAILLGVTFFRRMKSHEATEGVRSRLRLYALVIGGVAIVATLLVIVYTRNRTSRPFDLSPQSAQVDTLRAAAVSDSLRLAAEQRTRALRDSANAILLEGVNLAARGQIPEAIARYDRAMEIDSSFVAPIEYKGYALFRLGQVPKAIETMRWGLEKDASNPWAHYNYALALWAAGDTTTAVDQIEETLRLDPGMQQTIRGDIQFRDFRRSPRFIARLSD